MSECRTPRKLELGPEQRGEGILANRKHDGLPFLVKTIGTWFPSASAVSSRQTCAPEPTNLSINSHIKCKERGRTLTNFWLLTCSN